ncbi:MAG: enoyl-CoA hydratase [Phycisphaerales bacterium JB043]
MMAPQTPSGEPLVLTERLGQVALVTLNRPDSLNALSSDLRDEIASTFQALTESRDILGVILTGRGKAFSAGLDLKELARAIEQSQLIDAVSENEMIRAIRRFDRPLIGAINGFAITGGLELALACDFLVASSSAHFADTHTLLGIMPGWGLSQLLPRRIGLARAMEMSFTARFIDAPLAYDWGLVNHVVDHDALLPTCIEMAQRLTHADRRTLLEQKRVMRDGSSLALDEGLSMEAEANRRIASTLSARTIGARRELIQQLARQQLSTHKGQP